MDPNALFCDICGTARDIGRIYQVQSEVQRNIGTLTGTLQSLEVKKAALLQEIKDLEDSAEKARLSQKAELELLDNRGKTLTDALTVEVESSRNKRGELTKEIEALTSQIHHLESTRKSEESAVYSLQKQTLELKRGIRTRARKAVTKPKGLHRGIKREAHTFIGKYEGKVDWNTELARLISQSEISLDHASYAVSPEKIVFSVTGSRDSIEKFAAALNSLNGFVNLRSKLAATRRSLRESVNAKNLHKEQLDSLHKVPWYKRNIGSLTKRKNELSQKLAEDDLRIKAISEDLKTLEQTLGSHFLTGLQSEFAVYSLV